MPQYDKLKTVNAQLHRFGETCMKYHRKNTYFVGGFTQEELKMTGKTAIETLDTAGAVRLHAQGSRLIVGCMEGDGGEALLIVAADDPYAQHITTHRVCFESEREVCVLGLDGEKSVVREENGRYAFELDTCHAALLMVE